MAVITVAQFAEQLKRPTEALIEQLASAGVPKASPDDALTEADKERLLEFLRSAHGTAGGERKKITLTRKSTSEIKQADSSGKARTIQVEVRKKRVFVKRDDTQTHEDNTAAEEAAAEAELHRREEEAERQAEELRRQEEALAESRRQREELERQAREAADAEVRAAAEARAEAERVATEAASKSKTPSGEPATDAPAEPVVPPKPVIRRVVKGGDAASEDALRQVDLEKRRKAAEKEAAAIRAMMSAPRKVMLAKKPEEPKPEVKEVIKGTIHKPKGAVGAPAPGSAKPGDKKQIKSEKLSSSWADDAAKKRALKTRGDGGGRPGWRAPRGGRRGGGQSDSASSYTAPVEFQAQEVHVPETISVADLAHKMSVKAGEVIKQLMKLGQMVTINQQLDQETAMIVVQEMGHQALAAKLDDPEAFTEEETAAHDAAEAMPRAPVVTVMGHVDHGKTSLLDYMRRCAA